VDQLVNPALPCAPADCEKFLLHFAGKVEIIRSDITPSPAFLDVDHPLGDSLSNFSAVTLPELADIMSLMRISSSQLGFYWKLWIVLHPFYK